MTRETLIAAFLDRHGYGTARAEPLAQDASFRRYLRLTGGPRPAVLMDAPPPEDIRPFVCIAQHLAGIGVSAPEIFGADETEGLLLEEDLGDDVVATLIDTPPVQRGRVGEADLASSASLFELSVDVLVAMQRAEPPPDLPHWDAATMATTALATLFDWWWPAMFGTIPPEAARHDFATALETMLAPVAAGPVCFVHRDFFAGNLLWLPQRNGIRRVGLLDFQNAAIGHPAYDLASLLQDARRDIASNLEDHAIAHYLASAARTGPGGIPRRLRSVRRAATPADCRPMGAPRTPRWQGRLSDPRPTHLAPAPAVRAPTGRRPLVAALDRWIPPYRRCNPPDLAA